MMSMFEFSEEQQMLRDAVRRMAQEVIVPRAAEIDERQKFPWDIVKVFQSMGLTALMVPEEYGGMGGNLVSHCLVLEEVARVDASCAVILSTQQSLAFLLTEAGTEEQRRHFLPQIADGKLTCVALTEPGAGSDAASITTRAELRGDHYILNGVKRFITNGDVADFIVLFARVGSQPGSRGIAAFIVEQGTPGLTTGKREKKMGIHGTSTVELFLEDVRVPAFNRVGPDEGVPNAPLSGFKLAMKSFDKGRAANAALATGLAQGALDYAAAYARERVQFGQPIASFQGLRFMMADMAMHIEAARSLTYRAAAAMDARAAAAPALCAMAKCFASDVAMRVTTDAVQILGGYGYIQEYPVERMMRDAKILQIYEGTNQIQRVIIARDLLGRA